MRDQFSKFARVVANVAGHPLAFALAVLGVAGWAIAGPSLGYSEEWQLWINTTTTILTFLIVFLLQHSQNRDSRSAQIKLDELLRAVKGARNELIDLENLSEEELTKYYTEFREMHLRYAKALKKKAARKPVRRSTRPAVHATAAGKR